MSYTGLKDKELEKVFKHLSQARWVPEEEIEKVGKPEEVFKPLMDLVEKSIKPAVESMFKRIVQDMRKISGSIIDGKLEEAIVTALPYAVMSIATIVAVELLQTKFAGFGLDIKKTVDKIDRLISPELIFSALTGVMIGRGIELPGVYLFNSLFTPEIPSEQDIAQMYYEGKISREDAYRYMRFHGKSDKFTQKLFEIWDYTPTFYIIERFFKYYPPPDELLEEFMDKNRMVNPKHRAFYREYFKWMLIRDEYEKIEGAIKDLYVNGYIDEEEFEDILESVIKTEVERNVTKDYADIVRERNLRKYFVNKNIYLYRHGVIDEVTLLERLKDIGVTSDFAEAIVELEAARKGKEWYPSGEAPS